MYTWPGAPFNGDRYKSDNYLEVLTQQLRENSCLKIAKNEEEPQQQQQQQQQGGNPTNAPGPFLSLEIILETFFKTQHHLRDLPKLQISGADRRVIFWRTWVNHRKKNNESFLPIDPGSEHVSCEFLFWGEILQILLGTKTRNQEILRSGKVSCSFCFGILQILFWTKTTLHGSHEKLRGPNNLVYKMAKNGQTAISLSPRT